MKSKPKIRPTCLQNKLLGKRFLFRNSLQNSILVPSIYTMPSSISSPKRSNGAPRSPIRCSQFLRLFNLAILQGLYAEHRFAVQLCILRVHPSDLSGSEREEIIGIRTLSRLPSLLRQSREPQQHDDKNHR